MGDQSEEARRPFRFARTIDLGQIVQVLILLGAVGGWAIAGYYTIQQQLSVHDRDIQLLMQRVKQDEDNAAQARADERSFNAETRAYLDRISGQIADLRALVAAKK